MVRTIYQQLSPAEVHGQLAVGTTGAQVNAAPDLLALGGPLAGCGPAAPVEPAPERGRGGTGCRRGAWWARCWPSNTTSSYLSTPNAAGMRGTADAQYAGMAAA